MRMTLGTMGHALGRMARGAGAATLGLATLLVAAPEAARADGLEYAGAGARGTMRGGAMVAGVDDAMALAYNPANLANVRGMQLHASVGLLFYSSCYDRDGTYGWSPDGVSRTGFSDPGNSGQPVDGSVETGLPDGVGGTLSMDDIQDIPTPTVCNSHRLNVVPELAYAWRINDRIGLGIGVIAPTAPGNLQFGDDIGGRHGMVRTAGLVLPSPARYQLISQTALMAWPTVGVGVEVAPKVRVGASFGWGFGTIGFGTAASPYYSENISTGIYAKVSVSDWFIPRVGVGISGGPWAGVTFGANFTYYGDVNATGSLNAQTLYYLDQPTRAGLRTQQTINGVTLGTQLPWQAQVGVRYASIRENVTLAEGSVGDYLDTERWNVEAQVGYTASSRLHEFAVRLGPTIAPTLPDGSLDTANFPCNQSVADAQQACVNLDPTTPAGVPRTFPAPVRHNWVDQITLRIGGDYVAVPGRLSVSGGFSYDGNGQQRGYEQLDFQPYRRFGTHLGFTVRINRWDVFVAYAHHFNQTRTVHYLTGCTGTKFESTGDTNGNGNNHDAGEPAVCDAPTPQGPSTTDSSDSDWGFHPLAASGINYSDVANSGVFRSHLDTLQLGATYHFR